MVSLASISGGDRFSPAPGSGPGATSAARQANQLTQEQQAQVAKLAQTDRAVRAHEQAHLAAAGGYAHGGASYSFARGPDGQLYAVAGEVSIDTSPESDPEKTIAKARVIQAAANAPADPSGQDRAVAAAAAQMEATARQELAAKQQEQVQTAYGHKDEPESGKLLSLLV